MEKREERKNETKRWIQRVESSQSILNKKMFVELIDGLEVEHKNEELTARSSERTFTARPRVDN
jgi:hypothetical protein